MPPARMKLVMRFSISSVSVVFRPGPGIAAYVCVDVRQGFAISEEAPVTPAARREYAQLSTRAMRAPCARAFREVRRGRAGAGSHDIPEETTSTRAAVAAGAPHHFCFLRRPVDLPQSRRPGPV